ncbi:serine hydrolase [Wenzhouxiangella sp. XN201]|uniref:serine hydrolase n=1 Tax=Wenzhouxiangella sp. XN201 TaxID=2710755 RepID=UPI0013CA0C22|nr:serine hydrolase [Wenzhouxiangella sp. XN201]NEZ04728.1 serine hydrolase [Wenzhouxiangella sp. XN201]
MGRIIAGVFAAAFIAAPCWGQADDGFAEQASEMLGSIYTEQTPGAVVVVSRDGEVVFNEAFGMASLELNVPMAPDHILRLASVTKQYTAAAILALAEDGKLSLDDPLSKFLPDFPVGEVTVHQLLNHTSGIKSYTSIEGYMSSERIRKDLTTDELVAVFADEPVDFSPGEQWSYNNSGYVLLGAIIEQVTDKPWNEFIRERLLEPLEIESTDAYADATVLPGRVPGYAGPADEPQNAGFLSMTQPHAAGSLMSTAIDVDRWQRALHGGRVLSDAMYERMIAPDSVSREAYGGHDYGYGLLLTEWMGQPAIYHGGGINGFMTMTFWLPEPQLSIILLTNRAGPGHSNQDITLRLAGLAMDKSYPGELPELELSDEALKAFQGTYRIDEETVRTLRFEDGKLISQRQGGSELRVIPVEGDRLVFTESISWFTVERDDSGAIVALILHQGWGGDGERAERVSDEVWERESTEVSAEQLDRLTGRYEIQPGFVLTVRVVDGGMQIQATGQPPFTMQAESPVKFYNSQIGADIVFDLPETGPASGLTLYQGGQELPAPRINDEVDSE